MSFQLSWAALMFGVVGGQCVPSIVGHLPLPQRRLRIPQLPSQLPAAIIPVKMVGTSVSTLRHQVPMVVESWNVVGAASTSYALQDLVRPLQGACRTPANNHLSWRLPCTCVGNIAVCPQECG